MAKTESIVVSGEYFW